MYSDWHKILEGEIFEVLIDVFRRPLDLYFNGSIFV